MTDDRFGDLIKGGDIDSVRRALAADASLANRPIRWYLNQWNESDPLHYVSDCVGHGWLPDGKAGPLAELLIAHGARIDGDGHRETPLIGSVSLGAERVSSILIDAGAKLEPTSVFGARALHWAAWMGAAPTVQLLLARGAATEARCSEFGATPLFWAVHGYGPDGPKQKTNQVAAARMLIDAGADVHTANKDGALAIDLARVCDRQDMHDLFQRFRKTANPGHSNTP